DAIPALPANFYLIMEAINDPESNVQHIGDLISRDVGLTTKLLRLVNSAYFGLSTKVATISHSLNILGLSPLGNLVLASTLMSQLKGIPEYFVTKESFWSHSVACGIAAREISVLKSLGNGELLYIAGMIHDIGSLVIYKEYPEKAKIALTQCNEWGQNLIDSEKSALGFDHAQVGSALIEKWKLPEVFQETTEYHHQPLNAPFYKEETAIVYLADYIVQCNQLGSSGEIKSPDLDLEVLKILGLPIKILPWISERTKTSFEEVYKILAE
ncbi:MAG: HDOD domain-containing protein, partial [Nitrospinae bacterium]|nr:HDOD domain-containing protein [Nitrospinota bacterium]